MKLGKYIHDLLLEHETVIIPGFGAFLSEYKPAEISETEIKPPSRQISFSSNIRNNDGLLVGYIANIEQVSHFDALKIIEKERDNIVFLLDKGEEVTLEETGKLFHSEKDGIQFTSIQNENLLMESFALEAVSLEKLMEDQPEPEINKEYLTEEKPVGEEEILELSVENEKQETIAEVSGETNESFEEVKVQETNEIQEEVINEVSEVDSDSISEKVEPAPEPVTVTEEIPVKEKEKKAVWYWYLLILIPLVVAGFFMAKNIMKKKPEITESKTVIQPFPQKENHTEETQIVVPDSAKTVHGKKVLQDSSIIVQPEQTKAEEFVPGQPVYYLIGGSFKESEDRAMTYMEELKEKGFDPFYMGKRGNFYMVGIGKYKTEGQAVRARDTFWENYPDLHLWVFKE